MSQNAAFYLADWDPITQIALRGGGPEAIWSKESRAVETNLLVRQPMSDAHEHLTAWQAVTDYYKLLMPRIRDEDQAEMLGELLNGFGIMLEEHPCDLDRLEELKPKPLPMNWFIATGSISPDCVRQLLSTCSDIDWDSLREPGEQVIQELAESNDLTWIQSCDEFMEFCRGLLRILRKANRWSAGIIIWSG